MADRKWHVSVDETFAGQNSPNSSRELPSITAEKPRFQRWTDYAKT